MLKDWDLIDVAGIALALVCLAALAHPQKHQSAPRTQMRLTFILKRRPVKLLYESLFNRAETGPQPFA